MHDSTFENNLSKEHFAVLSQSNATITNSTFTNNFSNGGTHGWDIEANSAMLAKNITVTYDEENVRKMMNSDVQTISGYFIVNG